MNALPWKRVLLGCVLVGAAVGTPACRTGDPAVGRAIHRFLISSAKLGDLPGIRAALVNGAAVNRGDDWDRTALMHAAAAGHVKAVRYLRENGADVNRRSRALGTTALMSAASRGHFHVVEYLLSQAVDVDAVETEGRTALMYAIAGNDPDIIALLLESNANIEHQDRMGYTALALAVMLGHRHIVQFLVRKGAQVNRADGEGRTPLDHALEREFTGIASVIRKAGGKRTFTLVRPRGRPHAREPGGVPAQDKKQSRRPLKDRP